MIGKRLRISVKWRWTFVCACILISNLASSAFAIVSITDTAGAGSDFNASYRDLTKQLLLIGIDCEKFSLNYRLESLREPSTKRLRYFLGQEAAASGLMAGAIVDTDQFNKALTNPLNFSPRARQRGNTAVFLGNIIGGSSSLLELASNGLHALKDRRLGFDRKRATQYLVTRTRRFDLLLAERARLLESRSGNARESDLYKAETKVLTALRELIVYEHCRFEMGKTGFRASENIFYGLNVATNAVGATASEFAVKAVKTRKFGGTAGGLSVVAFSMTMASPIVSATGGAMAKKLAAPRMSQELAKVDDYDLAALKSSVQQLQTLVAPNPDKGRTDPAQALLDVYGVNDDIISRQVDSETIWLRRLSQVAVQNTVLAQLIGGAGVARGTLGLVSYYHYSQQPRPALYRAYAGAIAGTAGASLAVGATALGMLADSYYIHHLKSEKRLPEQLLQERIKDLNEVETRVKAL